MNNSIPERKDLSVSMGMANVLSLLFVIPSIGILLLLYLILWGFSGLSSIKSDIYANLPYIIILLVISILLHEIIHGIAWAYFGKKSIKKIKYGISLKTLTPYAHCMEPMNIRGYRLGAIMPGIIMGLVPSIIGLITGVASIMLYGLFFTAAAGGDFLIIWLLRKENKNVMVKDHPSRAGCYVEPEKT
jgi:hypothetical protein